jgi:hypothetical protein
MVATNEFGIAMTMEMINKTQHKRLLQHAEYELNLQHERRTNNEQTISFYSVFVLIFLCFDISIWRWVLSLFLLFV